MTSLGSAHIAAVWSEKGQVEIYDLKCPLAALSDPQTMVTFLREEQAKIKPLFSFAGHMTEGFALDWSPKVAGEQGPQVGSVEHWQSWGNPVRGIYRAVATTSSVF